MFETLLKKIAQGLDKANIPYMVIGGQAVLLYGEPRLTRDIDITLGVGPDKLDKIKQIVTRLKLHILVDNVDKFVRKTLVLPVTDKKSGIRVDFIFSFSSYERQAIDRARSLKFNKTIVKFGAPEDIIIHKIISGRARDIDDIMAILLKNPKYNIRYITKWLKAFDKSLGETFTVSFKKVLKDIK